MKKIYISPSDQTRNEYAAGGTTEAVQCREIAVLLAHSLERNGFDAKTNIKAGMAARVEESQEFGADLHVCVHTNAYDEKPGQAEVAGTRLFCYAIGGEGYKACQAVMARLAPVTPGTSDGISARPELYEVRVPSAPTVYVEVDFHDVPDVADWIIAHKADIAEAIAHGICDHYRVAYKAPATAQTPAAPKDPSGKMLRVQIWAGHNRTYAEETLAKAKAAGFSDAFIVE